MSTVDDLLPDVEYESDASTASTSLSGMARKKILKSHEGMNNSSDISLIIFGLISAFISLISPFLPFGIGTRIGDLGKIMNIGVRMLIYSIIYGILWFFHFINVF